ncbi:MAG: hypothetical protein KDD66_16820, partial [Bdellovibrionales bacterium]|nr:hypothetical protein [Bdellovibrionales bacterium]
MQRYVMKPQMVLAVIVALPDLNPMMISTADPDLRGAKDEEIAGPFNAIIVDYRNKALVKRITEGPHEKIFITYGSNHLFGIVELLQQHNPAWKVESVKWLRTIEPPRQYDRELAIPEA